MCTLIVQSTEGQRSALPRSLLDGVQDIEDAAGLTFYLLFTTFYFLQESSWWDRFIKVLYVLNYVMFNDFK